jgi:hypothetical protein
MEMMINFRILYLRSMVDLNRAILIKNRCGGDRIVVGFNCAIRAYHHYSCEFKLRLWRGVLGTTLCNKVYQ